MKPGGGKPALTGRLQPVWDGTAEDAESARIVRSFVDERWTTAEVLGRMERCWGDPWLENRWANFVTDGIRERTQSDISFAKVMTLLPALDTGEFTEWDIETCLPGNNLLLQESRPSC